MCNQFFPAVFVKFRDASGLVETLLGGSVCGFNIYGIWLFNGVFQTQGISKEKFFILTPEKSEMVPKRKSCWPKAAKTSCRVSNTDLTVSDNATRKRIRRGTHRIMKASDIILLGYSHTIFFKCTNVTRPQIFYCFF